ncbi:MULTISPECIES: hypothetical protein [Actinoalloteichus]|uniref:Uncharacterized protein n=1 Tax=Actinoalloteichus fjordicus TaxID=1612552 RepID=A0AAC9LF98_9PSEU|nr:MULTISPECIES: hypothetical protein [Actinoalloteichus]APU16557.1 hypothetical protein UA74_22695 [Actinoalloteichus fjordicus]APU22625.1 hypothetical protein UA75_23215 [Actinoalloteichus sp. GBA129-24]
MSSRPAAAVEALLRFIPLGRNWMSAALAAGWFGLVSGFPLGRGTYDPGSSGHRADDGSAILMRGQPER